MATKRVGFALLQTPFQTDPCMGKVSACSSQVHMPACSRSSAAWTLAAFVQHLWCCHRCDIDGRPSSPAVVVVILSVRMTLIAPQAQCSGNDVSAADPSRTKLLLSHVPGFIGLWNMQ